MVEKYFFQTYSCFFDFANCIDKELIIICPFIKLSALKKIIKNIPNDKKIIVVARWKIEDLVLGSSDLEIYTYLKELGHKFYINNKIHLKVIIKDKKEILLGSANITNKGLGFIENSNIEAVSIDDINTNEFMEILKILKSSISVTNDLFQKINNKVKQFEEFKKMMDLSYKKMREFDKNNFALRINNIVTMDFPFCKSLNYLLNKCKKSEFNSSEVEHDLVLFRINKNEDLTKIIKKLKSHFLSSDAFIWQDSIINTEFFLENIVQFYMMF